MLGLVHGHRIDVTDSGVYYWTLVPVLKPSKSKAHALAYGCSRTVDNDID